MKLLFEWLFVALLEVAWEGLPARKKKRKLRAFPSLHQASRWGCVLVLSFLLTHLPERLGRWLGLVT